MKKVFFLTSIVLLLAYAGMQAQAVKSIALKPGLVWATQKYTYKNIDPDQDILYKTAFHIGLNVEFLQHPYISILAEVGYTQKGHVQEWEVTTSEMPEGTGEMETYCTNFDYGYIAPMFKLRKEFGDFVPYIFVGPRLDYQLSFSSDFEFDDIKDDFNKVIFGMNYGLGLEYMIGPMGLGLIFHQQLDFSDVYCDPPENIALESIKNNAFVLDIGVKYYFGKK